MSKKINVNVLTNPSMYCLESAFATTAYHYGIDYQLMFIPMLSGIYFNDSLQTGLLGKQISLRYTEDDILYSLFKFHGIKISKDTCYKVLNIDEIKKSIDNNKFGIVKLSEIECPWITNGSTDNTFLLFHGYDDISVNCYDLHNEPQKERSLNFDFLNNHKIEIVEQYFYSIEKPLIDISKVDNFFDLLDISKIKIDEFYNACMKVKNALNEDFNIKCESNTSQPLYCDFMDKIVQITRSKYLISMLFEYLYEKSNISDYKLCSIDFDNYGKEWTKIWSKFFLYFSSDLSKERSYNSVSNIISNVSNAEYETLLRILKRKS